MPLNYVTETPLQLFNSDIFSKQTDYRLLSDISFIIKSNGNSSNNTDEVK